MARYAHLGLKRCSVSDTCVCVAAHAIFPEDNHPRLSSCIPYGDMGNTQYHLLSTEMEPLTGFCGNRRDAMCYREGTPTGFRKTSEPHSPYRLMDTV